MAATAVIETGAAQPFPAARAPLTWPFADTSIWNMPDGRRVALNGKHADAGPQRLPRSDGSRPCVTGDTW